MVISSRKDSKTLNIKTYDNKVTLLRLKRDLVLIKFSWICIFFLLPLFSSIAPEFENRFIQKNLIDIPECDIPSGVCGVDRIYYINLDSRKERNSRLQRMLIDYGVHADRVSAFNGYSLSKRRYKQLVGYENVDPAMTIGAVGCALSHFSIWRDAYEHSYGAVWILEDDIEFWEPHEKITEMILRLDEIDPEWDVFFTDPDTRTWDGTFYRQAQKPPGNNPEIPLLGGEYYFKRESIDDDLERIHLRIGAYSMIVSHRGIKKYMEFHTLFNIWTHVDVSIHLVPGIREYVAKNALVTHTIENRTSDTEEQRKLKKKRKS